MNYRLIVTSILVVAALVGSGCGAAATRSTAAPASDALEPAAPRQLYVTDRPPFVGMKLTAIDGRTLEDVADPLLIKPYSPRLIASADGATLAAVSRAALGGGQTGTTVRLLSPTAATELARLDLAVGEFNFPQLTADGSRLILREGYQPAEWLVFDTTSGEELGRIPVLNDEFCCWNWGTWLDPAGERLYQLVVPSPYQNERMKAPELVAYALDGVAEVGRLVLANLRAGSEGEGEEATFWRPGLALSPDGRRLAIVHADRSAVTLIDTERLAVEETVDLSRPVSWLERLGLQPGVARAKGLAGTQVSWQVQFAPDGRRLYAVGLEEWYDEYHTRAWRGLGLRLIDLERRRIVAETLPEVRLEGLVVVPDGSGVYAFGPAPDVKVPDEFRSTYVLRRLDPATLAVTAEREFAGYRELLLLALPPG